MNEYKRKLVFWRGMSLVTALGGILYIVKYDVDIVFIIILLAFVLMFDMTQTLKNMIKG